jgi:alpha-tubulin suppressor-like RCC1 family protein
MLGNGQMTGASSIPTRVSTDVEFQRIYAGPTSCALTANGQAYCWGVNDYGALGDSSPPIAGPETAVPVLVRGNKQFTALALGGTFVCGWEAEGSAFCWGYNSVGQLGDNSVQHRSYPAVVAGGLKWKQLSAGGAHACGIATNAGLYCWGYNGDGQFGNGQKGQSASSPQLIERPTRFARIVAGGSSTCGLTASGVAFCWGRGDHGQLGNGAKIGSSVPVPVVSPR